MRQISYDDTIVIDPDSSFVSWEGRGGSTSKSTHLKGSADIGSVCRELSEEVDPAAGCGALSSFMSSHSRASSQSAYGGAGNAFEDQKKTAYLNNLGVALGPFGLGSAGSSPVFTNVSGGYSIAPTDDPDPLSEWDYGKSQPSNTEKGRREEKTISQQEDVPDDNPPTYSGEWMADPHIEDHAVTATDLADAQNGLFLRDEQGVVWWHNAIGRYFSRRKRNRMNWKNKFAGVTKSGKHCPERHIVSAIKKVRAVDMGGRRGGNGLPNYEEYEDSQNTGRFPSTSGWSQSGSSSKRSSEKKYDNNSLYSERWGDDKPTVEWHHPGMGSAAEFRSQRDKREGETSSKGVASSLYDMQYDMGK
ncbi:hypothetical protein QFC21_006616 [Naganishia friedmannii]|uniref:Uncharacterized protein n=1 Tax=Naganishia friedmannii TaxID=89922 RepID=A0ACC2V0P8_9TREE|nr:hypothetical protein QFC21_006616 [Naganishia friedmannii]